LDEILEIHLDQIKRYGGSEGIRDLNLLQSALAMPEAGMGDEYFHRNLFEMAAAYLFHLVKNHPFIDGNKRVGAMAAYVFLKLNGLTLSADEKQLEEKVLQVVSGNIDKAGLATFFKRHCNR